MQITLKRFGTGSFLRYEVMINDSGEVSRQVLKPKQAFEVVKDLYHFANAVLINPKKSEL